MTKQEARQRTAEIGIVPAVRTSSSQKVLLAADALKQGGIGLVELTLPFLVPNSSKFTSELSPI